MLIRNQEITDDLFNTVFKPDALRNILYFVELKDCDYTEEDLSSAVSLSLEKLIEFVQLFCNHIPGYTDNNTHSEEQIKISFDKLILLLSTLRAFKISDEKLNLVIDNIAATFFNKFVENQKQQPWFSMKVFELERQDDNSTRIAIEQPTPYDLILANLSYQAHYSFINALKLKDRKRDIVEASFKGVSLGLLALTTLPPLAVIYSILALPFSLYTSFSRRQIGLWRSIQQALPTAVKIGPEYAYKSINEATKHYYSSQQKLQRFSDNTSTAFTSIKSLKSPENTERPANKNDDLMTKISYACHAVANNGTVLENDLLSYNHADIDIALKGNDIADMIARVIQGSNSEIMIQTFAWEKDTPFVKKINQALQAVLARKRQAMVDDEPVQALHVYIIIDERGRLANITMSGHQGQKWPCDPQSLGLFNEPGLVEVHAATFHHNLAGGTHAKTIVIDNQQLILTGANFQASNFGHFPAYDGAIKIRGPIAQAAREDFCTIWANRHIMSEDDNIAIPKAVSNRVPSDSPSRCVPMIFATRCSSSIGLCNNNPQNAAFITAIENAKSLIRIATPNLNVPDIKKALVDFVRRGGRLELMLGKGFNDNREVIPGAGGTNQKTVNELLGALQDTNATNCDIRWFSLDGVSPVIDNVAGAAHIKFMAIDEQVVIFGNANHDNISSHHLHECNVVIGDEAITNQLSDAFFNVPFATAIPAIYENLDKKAVPGTKQTLEIIKKENVGSGFSTFYLRKPDNWIAKPGQYCEIRSGNYFSAQYKHSVILAIASGTNENEIIVTGRASTILLRSNHALTREQGQTLEIIGPIGTCFPMSELKNRSLLLIGGGSGITALRSVMHSLPDNADVRIVYSAKTSADLIYQSDVNAWRENKSNYITLTQENVEGCHYGRFTNYLQQMELPENVVAFICGPTQLVRDTAQQLHGRGLPLESIYGSLPTTALKGGPVYRADHMLLLGQNNALVIKN